MTVIAYTVLLTLYHLESTIVRSTLINDHGGPVTVIAYTVLLTLYHLESTMYQSSTINSTVCVQLTLYHLESTIVRSTLINDHGGPVQSLRTTVR